MDNIPKVLDLKTFHEAHWWLIRYGLPGVFTTEDLGNGVHRVYHKNMFIGRINEDINIPIPHYYTEFYILDNLEILYSLMRHCRINICFDLPANGYAIYSTHKNVKVIKEMDINVKNIGLKFTQDTHKFNKVLFFKILEALEARI